MISRGISRASPTASSATNRVVVRAVHGSSLRGVTLTSRARSPCPPWWGIPRHSYIQYTQHNHLPCGSRAAPSPYHGLSQHSTPLLRHTDVAEDRTAPHPAQLNSRSSRHQPRIQRPCVLNVTYLFHLSRIRLRRSAGKGPPSPVV